MARPDTLLPVEDVWPATVARLRAAGCVYAEEEASLLVAEAASPDELAAMVDRRVAGHPLEQVLGWAGFYGLRVQVDAGVFVPRRRTELLVREAIDVAGDGTVAVDLCCGTGAVGAALVTTLPHLELHATDIDPAAVRCARRNLAAATGAGTGGVGAGPRHVVHQGDLYEALPATLQGRIDLLVVNAPYVPTDEVALMPPEARLHEPLIALDGGFDGLDVHRRVAADAPRWLAPGGRLLIETSERQASQAVEIFTRNGLAPHVAGSEELGATVVVGTDGRPGGSRRC
jgi:release factor glutamine methyltransferase